MFNLNPIYFLVFFLSFILTLILVPLAKKIALKFKLIDWPNQSRKIHQKPIPLLGGLAIFLTTFLVIFFLRVLNLADFSRVPDRFLIATFIGGLLLMIGGFLDDKYNLKPDQQIIWPLLAALTVLIGGIKISFITNPLGDLSNALLYLSPLVGLLISFFWLLGLMYTTKFLDGLDGLAAGIGAIAAIIIFALSLSWDVENSATGLWAIALAASGLGFLLFNWQPAKIFLGEGGSVFLGFILGVLSIISGSKIITTLLVMGLPALDVFWVIIRRLIKRQSPFSHADNKHLHYELLTLGLSAREAVLLLYLIALIFGLVALTVDSWGKLIAFLILVILMAVLSLIFSFFSKRKNGQKII